MNLFIKILRFKMQPDCKYKRYLKKYARLWQKYLGQNIKNHQNILLFKVLSEIKH
jgi:hypothetical protein